MEKYKKICEKLNIYKLDGLIISNKINITYILGESYTSNIKMILITKENILVLYKNIKSIGIFTYQNNQLYLDCPFSNLTDALSNILIRNQLKNIGFESKDLTFFHWTVLKKNLSGIELIPTKNFIEELRAIKTCAEIDIIKDNCIKTLNLFDMFVSDGIKSGTTEIEFGNNLEKFFRSQDIDNLPFRFEISSGKKSSLVNSLPSNNIIKEGDLLLIGFGIENKNYCTDIARTYAIGSASIRQQVLYKAVKNCQFLLSKEMRNGRKIQEIVSFMNEHYKKMGLQYTLPYDFGHGIGLEVHERPFLSSAYNGCLKNNMVISIEPGIHLESGGVRLEDVVLISESGCEFITNSPSEIPIINLERG